MKVRDISRSIDLTATPGMLSSPLGCSTDVLSGCQVDQLDVLPVARKASAPNAAGIVTDATKSEWLQRPGARRTNSVHRLLARRSRVQAVENVTQLNYVPTSLHPISRQILVALGAEPGQAHLFTQWAYTVPNAGTPLRTTLHPAQLSLAHSGSQPSKIVGLSPDGQFVSLAEHQRLGHGISVWCAGGASPGSRAASQLMSRDLLPADSGDHGAALLLLAGEQDEWVAVHEHAILRYDAAGNAGVVVMQWPAPVVSVTGGVRGLWTVDTDASLSYWSDPLRPNSFKALTPTWTLPLGDAGVPRVWAHDGGQVLACIHQGALHVFGLDGHWLTLPLPRGVGASARLTFVGRACLAIGDANGCLWLCDWAAGHFAEPVALSSPGLEHDAIVALAALEAREVVVAQESGAVRLLLIGSSAHA